MSSVLTPVAPRRFEFEPQPVARPLHPALTAGVSAAEKAAILSPMPSLTPSLLGASMGLCTTAAVRRPEPAGVVLTSEVELGSGNVSVRYRLDDCGYPTIVLVELGGGWSDPREYLLAEVVTDMEATLSMALADDDEIRETEQAMAQAFRCGAV